MDKFTVWEALSVLCRLGVAAIVVVKLWAFYDRYKGEERFGLGALGAGSFMTVPTLIEGPDSPFAEWAGALFALGVLIYMGGRLRRHFRHDRANRKQVRIAREHLESRR